MSIETSRLLLQPHAPDQLIALIDHPEGYAGLTGYPAAPGLRDFFVSGELNPAWVEKLRSLSGPDPWTLGFAVIHREDRRVIGTAAFKGAPTADSLVELAYGIVPAYEGRGYATEAAQALTDFAFDSGLVQCVLAHTLPVANASTHVLTKCGFTRVGDVIDPDDGPAWRWERGKTTS